MISETQFYKFIYGLNIDEDKEADLFTDNIFTIVFNKSTELYEFDFYPEYYSLSLKRKKEICRKIFTDLTKDSKAANKDSITDSYIVSCFHLLNHERMTKEQFLTVMDSMQFCFD